MISVPIAVYNKNFEWQLDLFWSNHVSVYGSDATKLAKAAVIRRNSGAQSKQEIYEWKAQVPHKMCESYFDYVFGIKEGGSLLPINIQVGLTQVLQDIPDGEVVELLDCDMFHLKKAPKYSPGFDEMIVSDIYEKWHLRSLTENRHVIEKYVGSNPRFYNGGFVPIIARAGTFKRLLLDWTWMHKDIVARYQGEQHRPLRWWAGMFSLQAACEVNAVKMKSIDMCYVPNVNQIKDSHHIVHYSVDPKFNKKVFPKIDKSSFPDNYFYKTVSKWMDGWLQPQTQPQTQTQPQVRAKIERAVHIAASKKPETRTELKTGITRAEMSDLYMQYLSRKPTERDFEYHLGKDRKAFERELASCPERHAAKSKVDNDAKWSEHGRKSEPLDDMDVKVAVGTNKNFCAKSLPIVLKSLRDSGVARSQIVVFNAGFDKRSDYTKDGIRHIELDHNSFENSAFIEIAERDIESKYWFFMHDTCRVGPRFKSLMLDVPKGAVKVALRTWPSMSIGLYDHNYITKHRERLVKIKNKNYSKEVLLREKLWGIPNEDFLLWLQEPELTIIYRNWSKRSVDNNNWFGGTAKRNTEYYPHLDLYKNKSDWHSYQGRNLEL